MARGYSMKISVREDAMGNLHAEPVSAAQAKRLVDYYGTADAFAQEGMALHYEVMDELSEGAKRDLRGGWDAVAMVPVDWYWNWIAFHNEPLPKD